MKQLTLLMFYLGICAFAAAEPADYLVKIPAPRQIYLTPDIDGFPPLYEGDKGGSFGAWSFTLLSLSGLASLDARENKGDSLVWIHSPGITSYTVVLNDIVSRTGAEIVNLPDLESVIRLGVDKGWVKGYIVYRADKSDRAYYDKIDLEDPQYNNSVNVATSLAADLGGILVDAEAEAFFAAMGLKKLLDVRDKDERWCFENYRSQFTRNMVHILDPKAPHMRDYAIATRSLCVFGVVPLVNEVLAWLEPNAPTLGWNGGDEFKHVDQLSRSAHFTTASNWIMNLPAMSCVQAGKDAPWEALQVNRFSGTDPLALDWPADTHFTSFILSDGDNVQWFLGGFANQEHAYWRAEHRGAFPFGWTMPVSHLSQVGASLLTHLAATATANDQAITFPSGYYYPDFYGSNLDGDTDWYGQRVGMFAERLGRLGVRAVINIAQDWESEGAMHAYQCFAAQVPDMAGIFALQYHPYNAGLGAIKWVPSGDGMPVPVVSPRFSIWSGLSKLENNGPPALVADKINHQPYQGHADSESYFDWTIVHAWSYFQRADTRQDMLAEEIDQAKPFPKDAFVRNGFEPAWWCVQRLEPYVRVVSPEELLWRIRIQLKTRETLDGLSARLLGAANTPSWQKQILHAYRKQLADARLDTAAQCRAAYLRLQDIYRGKLLDIKDLPGELSTETGR